MHKSVSILFVQNKKNKNVEQKYQKYRIIIKIITWGKMDRSISYDLEYYKLYIIPIGRLATDLIAVFPSIMSYW